jgi:hydrogenase maturation protein HypF
VVEVQHHHAHLASLMAEHGLDGREPVIGFVFDGTGYGSDGALWGGEVLIGDYAGFERWGHLRQVPLPGGDQAILNPCRAALAHLQAAGVEWCNDLTPVRACDETELRVLGQLLARPGSCAATTSIGRLFDAVASLLVGRHRITYEAQAAIELEILAGEAAGERPELRFAIDRSGTIDAAPVVRALVDGLRSGVDRSTLARSFHDAVVEAMVVCAEQIRQSRSLGTVGLTGGVFQNVLLSRLATARLGAMGFQVLTHGVVPPNDGGLALGQAMVASCRPDRSGAGQVAGQRAAQPSRRRQPCA